MAKIAVIDFDDTLFPTGKVIEYFKKNNYDFEKIPKLPTEVVIYLYHIDNEASMLIRNLKFYYTVKLLTNAHEVWIDKMLSNFMPQLKSSLRDVEIISAHDRYAKYTDDTILWKYYAMREIILLFPYSIDEFVSIGDSICEQYACVYFRERNIDKSYSKDNIPKNMWYIKMMENPDYAQLISQLSFLKTYFPCKTLKDVTFQQ